MPDVPQQSQDILRAARERAAIVAGQLDALGADLSKPRPSALGDADRLAGSDALAEAAAALRDLAGAINPAAAGHREPGGGGGEDVEHA